jgi:hypothetical protein
LNELEVLLVDNPDLFDLSLDDDLMPPPPQAREVKPGSKPIDWDLYFGKEPQPYGQTPERQAPHRVDEAVRHAKSAYEAARSGLSAGELRARAIELGTPHVRFDDPSPEALFKRTLEAAAEIAERLQAPPMARPTADEAEAEETELQAEIADLDDDAFEALVAIAKQGGNAPRFGGNKAANALLRKLNSKEA